MTEINAEALAAIIAQSVTTAVVAYFDASESAKPTKAKTVKAPASPKAKTTGKALTRKTLDGFKRAAKKDGYDLTGLSTWDVAYWAVDNGYSPKGFHVGPRYTEMAIEAGAAA